MRAEDIEVSGQPSGPGPGGQPGSAELAEAIAAHVNPDGSVPSGVALTLAEERGWSGRVIEVLRLLTENTETMGYLAGGRKPDEVATWLAIWVDCPLSVEQIKLVISARGWDPDPFVVLARAGLLERLLVAPDGSPRRIDGELAGGWVSDQLALATDEEIVQRVQAVIGDPPASS